MSLSLNVVHSFLSMLVCPSFHVSDVPLFFNVTELNSVNNGVPLFLNVAVLTVVCPLFSIYQGQQMLSPFLSMLRHQQWCTLSWYSSVNSGGVPLFLNETVSTMVCPRLSMPVICFCLSVLQSQWEFSYHCCLCQDLWSVFQECHGKVQYVYV